MTAVEDIDTAIPPRLLPERYRAPAGMEDLHRRIVECFACPRLVAWRESMAEEKRASFRGWDYWARPIPGFGDPQAAILVCGLAPAAHGGNRTGRVFTGDRSGDWLYAAMHRAGLANQPTSVHREDGLSLTGAYVVAAVRCAPPDNKPTPDERDRCLPYLADEITRLLRLRVIVCLGAFGWDGVLRALKQLGHATSPRPEFGHGAEARVGPYTLLGCYHPSQRNTFTGTLTEPMFDEIFARARRIAAGESIVTKGKGRNRG